MTPTLIFISFAAYTVMLFVVSWLTSAKSDSATFYLGNRQSPWYVVAYGMIGASLSGVTFISIPGDVGNTRFSYLMIVTGYLLGYFIIAKVLLPIYYKLNLTSIYSYLDTRFGIKSYKTGASFFLLSRIIGASFRMFLVVNVLQLFIFDAWNIPFWATVAIFMLLIWLYTYRSGIRTIVWTDTLQTTFMLLAVVVTVFIIANKMDLSIGGLLDKVRESKYSQVFYTDWRHAHFFVKDFFAGAFIAVVMTGLDQDMMQKNLSCKNLRDSQKNVLTLSWALVPVNLIFLTLGAVLYIYAAYAGIAAPERTDDLFPALALQYLGPVAGVVFMIGLIAAAYSSADSALTALTTSFTVDILGWQKRADLSERSKVRRRTAIHFGISLVVLLVIVIFRAVNDESVISQLFTIAGYTYGPLLGMFSFGLFTRYQVRDKWVPLVAVLAPVLCYFISVYDRELLNGYNFGFELLIINGILTFTGLFIIRENRNIKQQ